MSVESRSVVAKTQTGITNAIRAVAIPVFIEGSRQKSCRRINVSKFFDNHVY